MNILVAGGTGFLGSALTTSLLADGHHIAILTRQEVNKPNHFRWDGETVEGWGHLMRDMDAVINVTGLSTDRWPWTKRRKQQFEDSRVFPARALASAIAGASCRPRVYLQASGINHYGLRGDTLADESTPPGDDFLARLTVHWEAASEEIERLGVRRVICRTAPVLAGREGLLPLLKLPASLFFGGKFGTGSQAMPWIHLSDQIAAVKFLLNHRSASGPFNLIAPEQTSNADFMRAVAKALKRPYWFHIPTFLLRMTLGEMSALLTEGRYSHPRRLLELGFKFEYGSLPDALRNLVTSEGVSK